MGQVQGLLSTNGSVTYHLEQTIICQNDFPLALFLHFHVFPQFCSYFTLLQERQHRNVKQGRGITRLVAFGQEICPEKTYSKTWQELYDYFILFVIRRETAWGVTGYRAEHRSTMSYDVAKLLMNPYPIFHHQLHCSSGRTDAWLWRVAPTGESIACRVKHCVSSFSRLCPFTIGNCRWPTVPQQKV